MDVFELDAALARKTPGKRYYAHISGNIEDATYYGRKIRFAAPVECEFSYCFDGEDFALEGDVKATILENCARCDDECSVDVAFKLNERLVKEADDDAFSYSGDTLKLHDMLFELILLNAPITALCRPDCKGLCQKCGANLNYSECACSHGEDGPFSMLRGLFNDDKEV